MTKSVTAPSGAFHDIFKKLLTELSTTISMSSQSRRVESLDFFGEQPAMSLYLLHRAELIDGEVRGESWL